MTFFYLVTGYLNSLVIAHPSKKLFLITESRFRSWVSWPTLIPILLHYYLCGWCGDAGWGRREIRHPGSVLALFFFFKYVLWIMLLQLFLFFFSSLIPLCPATPSHQHSIQQSLSSCPWVIHISSLASRIPILFSTSPHLFCTYHLCFLFPVPFPPFSPISSPLITLHMISISVILFLF